jgi:putative redox protein
MPRSERVQIPGSQGHSLAAILDLPDGQPQACAIFAHCFTCSKDSLAAARSSRALAAHGWAVLRLDFTGLGASEGDFADSNFSTNLADLLAAADWLRAHHGPPRLLVGHSLGGAAVLAVAGQIDDVVAVATIGAPSEPSHVTHLLRDKLDQIEADGEATVDLGGRPFSVRKQFVDDLQQHDLLADVGNLGKALLVMHSPIDAVVSIDHAAAIYGAARHPKSFVTLDDADHLLLRAADAEYAACVLDAWATRYLPEMPVPEQEDPPAGELVVRETGVGRFQQQVLVGSHRLVADEPRSVGGDDTGPTPYDYLTAGLGACTAMTLRMYADHKGWPLEHVEVRLRHSKIHASDCADCETKKGKLDDIEREIVIQGDLDEPQRARLLEIADRCPVHRTLHGEVRVRSRLAT